MFSVYTILADDIIVGNTGNIFDNYIRVSNPKNGKETSGLFNR